MSDLSKPPPFMRQLTKADSDGPIVPPSPSNNSMSKPNIMRQVTKFYDKPSLLEEACKVSGGSINNNNIVPSSKKREDVLMIGSGEYTTGFIDNMSSETDKGAGVVALTMVDLRKRGKTGRLGICGVNGKKFPKIRQHMQRSIADVYHHDNFDMSIDTFPQDNEINDMSYIDALDSFQKGDAVIIFTPDDTHFDIALAAVNKGMHVLVTKPLVKTLHQHQLLHEAAIKNDVLVITEVHKRYDPIYQDARDKMMNQLGPFSYLYSYMSQPKYQLETFKAWAGKNSDISYYLNSHHIDFHEWCVGETARPVTVTALASKGVAMNTLNIDCEDTITLTVEWEVLSSNKNSTVPTAASDTTNSTTTAASTEQKYIGTAIYTSSWIAPRSDVHSQQRFFYMGAGGEVTVDQAHRGYSWANDAAGFKSVNPLFMKYTPTNGHFTGQQGYGYRSLEAFIDAVHDKSRKSINNNSSDDNAAENSSSNGICKNNSNGNSSSNSNSSNTTSRTNSNTNNNNSNDESGTTHDSPLATIESTYRTTAILEAGRRSLDSNTTGNNKTVTIVYGDDEHPFRPTDLVIL